LATLQFEEICGSKFTWDEPIVDSPDADDANSVMNYCLLVSHDKIGCQLIEPVAATTAKKSSTIMPTSREGSESCGGCKVLKYHTVELKKRDSRAEFEDRSTEF